MVKRLTAVLILGLAGFLSAAHPAVARAPDITAGEVVDRETLQAFVKEAKDALESATNFSEVASLVGAFRNEGDWKAGSMYLIVLTLEGVVQFHGANLTFEDKNVLDLEDARDVKVVQKMLAAAAAGGGFVEYYWDDPSVEEDPDSPKLTYAVPATVRGQKFVVAAGFYMDLSSVDAGSTIFEVLEVTARDVKDRETLKAFVNGLQAIIPILEENGPAYLATIQAAIRTEGEDFKYDSIFIIVLNTDGVVIFHGADPGFDGQNVIEFEDANGVKVFQEIIAAASAGGGFVEYHWDNPAVEGDENIGSPKLTYAIPIMVFGQQFAVASGIYFDLSDHIPEITLSVQPVSVSEGDTRTVTVTATQSSEILPVSTRLPLSLTGTATGDDYSVSGEMRITIPAEATVGSTELTFTVVDDAIDEPEGETIVVTASHDREELASATIMVRDAVARTEVEATVLGDAVEGLTVAFSRAISGRQPDYAWSAVTDANGQVSLTISSADGVSGYYQARARNADGETVGQWHSIPLNHNRRQVLELTIGGGMRIVSVEPLETDGTETATSGLVSNVPNPFNPSTQITYRLGASGAVRLRIYNTLGQVVRTLVHEVQPAGRYQVVWEGRDERGVAVASGVYLARLIYPGGVQARRLLLVK